MNTRTALAVGSKAPAFTLPDQDDNKRKLSDFAGKWVVLYFYPKDDTPGCTTEACEFTDGINAFGKLNATVIGISPDSVASHRKFIAKYKLSVILLSDADRKVMDKYGAYGIKKLYGKETMGVIRSTFVIDPKGLIAHSWTNVRAAGHAEKVREKLGELST